MSPQIPEYRVDLPANARVIVLYDDLNFASALRYTVPNEDVNKPLGDEFVVQYELRVPRNSPVTIRHTSGEFQVHRITDGETPIAADPITSIYSNPRTHGP